MTNLTLFTIPRAFTGAHATRQRNALSAWTRLSPRPEIILFCNDPGVREAASEFGCIHIPDIECNSRGVPYVSEAFRIAHDIASHDLLCYTNADILFTQSLLDGTALAAAHFPGHFTIVGKRWNITSGTIDFSDGWQGRLVSQAQDEAKQGRASALDYFCYRRGTVTAVDMPRFLVGSPGWDNWLAGKVVLRGIPLIDGTDIIWCIHQAHEHLWPDDGTRYNRSLQWEHGGVTGYTSSGEWALQDGQVRGVSPRMRVREVKYVVPAKARLKTRRGRVPAGVSLSRRELRERLTAVQIAKREAELERRERRDARRAVRDAERRRKSQAAAAAKPPLRRVKSPKKFVRRRASNVVGSPDLENRVPRRANPGRSGFRRKTRRRSVSITDVEAARDE